MSDEFSWNEAEKEGAVAIKSVQGVAVYRNPSGDLVIRQERSLIDDEDSFIIVPFTYIPALLKAIEDELQGAVTSRQVESGPR